jgi:hypothetical protein
MRRYTRHLVIGLTAALMLALAVGAASARNISVSNQNIRVVWSPLTFNGEGLLETRCNVTLEGSFHYRTIIKRERALIGLITRAGLTRPCPRGIAWIYNGTERNERLGNTTLPTSLPWHITYEGFTGTLPNITGIRILLDRARFLLEAGFLCNYTTGPTNGGNAAGTALVGADGAITGLRTDETRRISSPDPFCPEGRFIGTGRVTLLGTENTVFVRLI